MTGIDDAAVHRRGVLNGVKLTALVRDHLGVTEVGAPTEFAPGSALVHDAVAWVLVEERPASRLGAALAWAHRSGASALHLIAEQSTGVLARRAAEFTLPITVWHAEGRSLLPAVPEPFAPAPALPDAHDEMRALIAAGGAEPLVEHGVLVGEVRGLEVCRVVDDPFTGATRLEVGLGAHDREAFQMMHGDVPAVDSLRRVVDAVEQHRRDGAPPHPLNRLGAERLIRWRLMREPHLVAASSLQPVDPPVVRSNLKDPVPCVAAGVGIDGRPVAVVCASGVDLDVIPYAADARLAIESGVGLGEELSLSVAMPARDRVPVIESMAGQLRRPARLVSI